MSLKAKIEAVIYAAEEPVTLAQLAFLFGGEVLEAVQGRPEAPSGDDAGQDGGGESDPGRIELDPGLDLDSLQAVPVSEEAADDPDAMAEAPPESAPEAAEPLRLDAAPPEPEDAAATQDQPAATQPAATLAAVDEKRAGRLRDRAIRDGLRSIIAGLMDEYASGDRGMEIREIAGGYRVATKPEYHDAVRSFVKSLKPPMKLSLQALETLAVIAYKQPVTAPEVNEIRGVDSGGVLGSLMSRKLITTAGRKQVIGRPILYKTTREFLLRFGLKDINELPSIEEFEKMAGDMDIEDLGGLEDVAHTEHLPFEEDSDDVEADPAGEPAFSAVGGDAAMNEATAAEAAESVAQSAAVEANAGEPGVAVDTPAGQDDGPSSNYASGADSSAPESIELDSHLAEEVDSDPGHEVELITAVHPSTTVGEE